MNGSLVADRDWWALGLPNPCNGRDPRLILYRIRDRHPDEYDDYEFDPINQVRAAALEAIRDVEASR